MTHWIICKDDFSDGWDKVDLVCFLNKDDAVKEFEQYWNDENITYHLVSTTTRVPFLKVG